MDTTRDFEIACDALIRGYAQEKSMLDDDMLPAAETLAGQPDRLLALLRELDDKRAQVIRARELQTALREVLAGGTLSQAQARALLS